MEEGTNYSASSSVASAYRSGNLAEQGAGKLGAVAF